MLGHFFDFVGIGMSQLSASSNPDRTKPRVRERIPMKPRVRTLAHPWHSACKSSNPGALLAVSAQILEPRRVSHGWGPTLRTPTRTNYFSDPAVDSFIYRSPGLIGLISRTLRLIGILFRTLSLIGIISRVPGCSWNYFSDPGAHIFITLT